MKKYPYTESTDLIIYDQKAKEREKKQKVWLTAVCSALAASIFTAGVFGTGMYFMQKEYEQQHSKRGSCKCNNTIG